MIYYVLHILGITLLPAIVEDPGLRLAGFVVLTLVANIANQLVIPGYTAWNANFLQEEVRADYFNTASCAVAFTYIPILLLSFVVDQFSNTPYESMITIAVRYIAFAIAVIDCILWLVPKEYPYRKEHRIKITNVFTLPFKNKRFLGTTLLATLYTFALALPSAALNVYILQDVGVKYTLYNAVNVMYFFCFLFFSNMGKKLVEEYDLFRAFGITLFFNAATYFMYMFLTKDCVWLYVVIRLAQHVIGVFQ